MTLFFIRSSVPLLGCALILYSPRVALPIRCVTLLADKEHLRSGVAQKNTCATPYAALDLARNPVLQTKHTSPSVNGNPLTHSALKRGQPAVIQLVVRPRQGTPGIFDAYVCERLVCSSRQPLLDTARILRARKITPGTRIEMRHAGVHHVALRATVGTAAKLRVLEGKRDTVRFARWSAFECLNLSTRTGKDCVSGADPGRSTEEDVFDEAA
jgi:hypothetical protein